MPLRVLLYEPDGLLRAALAASLGAADCAVDVLALPADVLSAWSSAVPDAVVLDGRSVDAAIAAGLADRADRWAGALVLLGPPRERVERPAVTAVLDRPVVVLDLLGIIRSLGGSVGHTRVLALSSGEVDLQRQLVRRDDGTVRLTAKECEFLTYLADNPGRTVTRDELLQDVWGYPPGAAGRTRVVDKMLARLRAKIGDPSSNPHHIFTVYGGGYRFAPLPPERAQSTPAAAAEPARRGWVPPAQSRFVGRDDDLADLADDLGSGARLITVVGPGGVGKTRLVLEQSARLMERGGPPGGVWFCDLTEARAPGDLLRSLAALLGLERSLDGDDPVSDLGGVLAEAGDLLVVLDNLEQIVSAAAEMLALWLRLAPRVRFLATSREPLRIDGEVCFELDGLGPDDALALFVDRARTVRRGYAPDARDESSIRGLVDLLDHLPLAIELAAARSSALSPAQIRDRLEDNLDVLSSRRRDVTARQATLLGAIKWSWELLDGAEQRALAQLSVFRGGFFLDAAEAVVEAGDGPGRVLDLVESLVGRSLLRRHDSPGLGALRFRPYETVQRFAADRAAELGLASAAEERHQRWYLGVGEELAGAVRRGSGADALRRLALEADNLSAVLRRGERSDPVAAVRAALCLDPVISATAPRSARQQLLDRAVTASDELGPEWRAHALRGRGEGFRVAGRFREAEGDLLQALALAHESGKAALIGEVASTLGALRCRQGRGAEAVEHLRRALEIARQTGDRSAEGVTLGRLGAALQLVGDVVEATRCIGQAMHLRSELTENPGQALVAGSVIVVKLDPASDGGGDSGYASLTHLFGASLPVGRAREAHRALEKALANAQEAGDRSAQASLASSLALTGLDGEEPGEHPSPDGPEAHLLAALEAVEDSGNLLAEAAILGSLGRLHLVRGRPSAAHRALEEAAGLIDTLGARRLGGYVDALRGAALAALGRHRAATDAIAMAEEAARGVGDRVACAVVHLAGGLAWLASEEGEAASQQERDEFVAALAAGVPIGGRETPRKLAPTSVDVRIGLRLLEGARRAV